MLWEQRRESLCQRQRWHSGSRLHILWFSYLISKNTFFFPCFTLCMLPGCICTYAGLTVKRRGNMVILWFPFTWMAIHTGMSPCPSAQQYFCVKSCLFIHRSCTAAHFIAVASHSRRCILNTTYLKVMCNLFLRCCLPPGYVCACISCVSRSCWAVLLNNRDNPLRVVVKGDSSRWLHKSAPAPHDGPMCIARFMCMYWENVCLSEWTCAATAGVKNE